MKIVAIVVAALVTTASFSSAFAGNSPFCFGGSPTPKHICDMIKANQKPKPVVIDRQFTTGANSAPTRLRLGR